MNGSDRESEVGLAAGREVFVKASQFGEVSGRVTVRQGPLGERPV